jgi:hypothetical protein
MRHESNGYALRKRLTTQIKICQSHVLFHRRSNYGGTCVADTVGCVRRTKIEVPHSHEARVIKITHTHTRTHTHTHTHSEGQQHMFNNSAQYMQYQTWAAPQHNIESGHRQTPQTHASVNHTPQFHNPKESACTRSPNNSSVVIFVLFSTATAIAETPSSPIVLPAHKGGSNTQISTLAQTALCAPSNARH